MMGIPAGVKGWIRLSWILVILGVGGLAFLIVMLVKCAYGW